MEDTTVDLQYYADAIMASASVSLVYGDGQQMSILRASSLTVFQGGLYKEYSISQWRKRHLANRSARSDRGLDEDTKR